MHYTVNQIAEGEDELILNYQQMNPEVEEVLFFMEKHRKKLVGKRDGETIVFSPQDILYVEKVDNRTFAYTVDNEIQLDLSLHAIEMMLGEESYFRCSKSMILNVNRVERLKSLSSNRIDATLTNGEHIIISRTYASDFRKLLKGDRS